LYLEEEEEELEFNVVIISDVSLEEV